MLSAALFHCVQGAAHCSSEGKGASQAEVSGGPSCESIHQAASGGSLAPARSAGHAMLHLVPLMQGDITALPLIPPAPTRTVQAKHIPIELDGPVPHIARRFAWRQLEVMQEKNISAKEAAAIVEEEFSTMEETVDE